MRTFAAVVFMVVCGCAGAPQQVMPAPTSTSTPAPAATSVPSRTPAEEAAIAVVERQLAAYNAHDADAFAATYAEDVRLYQFPDQLKLEGRENLRAQYAKIFAASPQIHATVPTRIVQGAYVIDHELVENTRVGSAKAVAIYEVKDGLISRAWFAR